jgi:hypothetical protein
MATPPPLNSATSRSRGWPSALSGRKLIRAGHDEVGGAVLVAVGVAADDDGLGPARHEPRDAGDHDRLAEDHAAEDVADGAVGRPPHLLEPELRDPVLVGGDSGAFHTHAVLLDGVRGVDGDLVVGGVALLDRQVVVLKVDIQVGQDQLVLDELPDNPGHLVAVELYDGIGYLDLGHAAVFLPHAGALALALVTGGPSRRCSRFRVARLV